MNNNFTTRDIALAEYIQSRLNTEPIDIIDNKNNILYIFLNLPELHDIVNEFYETYDRTNRKI